MGLDSTIAMWREHAPSSYSLKIKNFSQFQKSTPSSHHRYISRCFASGGHNWRLIVYPKGNDKDEGNGFISMYVEIDNACLTATFPNEVYAYLTFSIYNKKQNNYFAIHDFEAKQFNTLRTIWGFPQVIYLDAFNDPESGFIFQGDECEFGVDVFVAPPPINCETLSFDDKQFLPKFCWTVKNFSELHEGVYHSESFSRGGTNWVLKLYPKGYILGDGKWASIFLYLADSESLKRKEDEKIYAEAKMRVLDPSGSNHLICLFMDWHEKSSGLGFEVSTDDLRKFYLDEEDNLNVEIEFQVVSTTNYSN